MQSSVFTAFEEHGCVWNFNDPQSIKIHQLIAHMITLDGQPFSITINEGYHALMHVVEL